MSDPLPPMIPLSPMGHDVPLVETRGPVTLTEITDRALASVAAFLGQSELCRSTLAALLQTDAPGIEALVLGTPYEAFWIGPDQWLVAAPHQTHEDLSARLKAQFAAAASVTEQTDGWVLFDLQGDVVPVMERLCPINMRQMKPGTARRTSIAHLGCFVTCRSAGHLRILGPRSSAQSLHHALATAITSAH